MRRQAHPKGLDVPHPLAGKTSVSIGVMTLFLAVPYLSPRLERFRIAAPWTPSAAATPSTALPVAESAPKLAVGEATLRASSNEATVTNSLPNAPSVAPVDPRALARTKGSIAVEDASEHALDSFYKALTRTRRKDSGAITRILHYGDSVITSDYISGTLRRRFQGEFGDGGHGFILIANPWEWYFHNDVSHGASSGWSSSRITGPTTKDGMYGLGGVTFTGSAGANAYFGTAAQGAYGKRVSRFDVYYLETSDGGDVEVKIGSETEIFSTLGDAKASRVRSFEVPDGEAKLALRVVSGRPRLFGVALERDEPGVVYDALGANGARAELLGMMNSEHWAEQMKLRKPALIVLQYGTNESEGVGIAANYEQTLTHLVEEAKSAAPDASILIAAPLDRAETAEGGGFRTKPIIKRLVDAQRRVAQKTGVAFWNTFEAMGGEGSMGKWVNKGLGGGDLTHPSPQGAELLGGLFFHALATGFDAWSSSHPNIARDE